MLASGSGFEDPTIRVWDAATGRLLVRLDGHTGWVCKLAFTRDGRRLISAAADQTIRFWDTSTWTETQVLRGHTDEVHAVAISEPAQLVASASKDGNLMLWKEDGKSAADGYRRLPESLGTMRSCRWTTRACCCCPRASRPSWWISSATPLRCRCRRSDLPPMSWAVLAPTFFATGTEPTRSSSASCAVRSSFNAEPSRWIPACARPGSPTTPRASSWRGPKGLPRASVYLASLAAPGRRIELRSDVPGLVPFRFSEDGNYLAAATKGAGFPARLERRNRADRGVHQRARPVMQPLPRAGGCWSWPSQQGNDHEIGFYDLAHPDRAPRRVPGRYYSTTLAVSPDGGLVASSTDGGQVRLFDPAKGELIESLHGHLNAAFGVAFSPDGRRLISASGGREAVKLWDVGTRQELLTLAGTGSVLDAARWSADGDVILAGPPWQAWRAPSWEEIAAAEAKEKTEIKQP